MPTKSKQDLLRRYRHLNMDHVSIQRERMNKSYTYVNSVWAFHIMETALRHGWHLAMMILIPCNSHGFLLDVQWWWMHLMSSCIDMQYVHFVSTMPISGWNQIMRIFNHFTIILVLITHNGFVNDVDAAPADMADAMWINQALSLSIPIVSCHIHTRYPHCIPLPMFLP